MKRRKKRGRRRAPIVVPRITSPPGSIVPPAHAPRPKMHVVAYDADRLVEDDIEQVALLPELRSKAGVLWVDIEGVGDAAVFETLGNQFALHPLALEDVVHLHQRPKAEAYGDHAYIVMQMPTVTDVLSFEQISLFVGPDYVITVQEGLPGDCLDPLRQRIRTARGRVRKGAADYLAYAVLDAVVDSYFPVVERLGAQLEQLEEAVFDTADYEAVAEVQAVRHSLHTLRRALTSSREAVGLLVRGETGPFSEPTLPFLRDCHDHTAQLLDAIDALRELAAGLIDLHLAGASNKMNEIMKVLTVIATIFIPLSFIAGLYGMNFDRSASPWNMPELGWALGYPFALALMLATVVGFLFYFRRRGWLGERHRRKHPRREARVEP